MLTNTLMLRKWGGLLLPLLTLLACATGPAATAIPAGRPANFIVQTITPTAIVDVSATEAAAVEAGPVIIAPLGDAPTHTPNPNSTPTPLPRPTGTPTLALAAAATGTVVTPTTAVVITPTAAAVAPTATQPPLELAAPLVGGDWDFEFEFVPWGNPFGEPCPGAAVAGGWSAFVEDGAFGSSCFNENLYRPNVQSGAKSQEITFDFIAANSGVFRTIPVQAAHRYAIAAYAKHDHSLSPVQMSLGVDFSGGTDWTAESVAWFPWDGDAEDTWLLTEETVTATGEQITIFIRGFHPLAEQGGKTVIDNVSVTHLGPE